MHIWPAIDLRGGKCVRLQQGDYQRETVFGDVPAAMARHWVARGARRLHLVDLDGARDGRAANQASVRDILAAVNVPCQLGGGIRDAETIRGWLQAGIARLVVGTRAIREPDWLREMAVAFPDRLVLGLDARDGRLATDGWRNTTDCPAVELLRDVDDLPLAGIVYTDIAADGMLAGPNFAALQQVLAATRLKVIASGGVTTAEQVARLRQLGVEGCIIGRALYEGRLTLEAALAAAGDEDGTPPQAAANRESLH